MRKLISILVVLGMVLGMTVVAAPVVADEECEFSVTLDPDTACAEATTTYCVNITSKYTMFAGNDAFIIEFPEGTTFGTTVGATVDGTTATATRAGLQVKVQIPASESPIIAGEWVIVCVAGVKNPAVAGKYILNVWADMLCCDPEKIGCAEYTIKPKVSTYKFVLDFGPTYEDIALDYFPPLKACTPDAFNLTFTPLVEGCEGWGDTDIWIELKEDLGGTITIEGDDVVLDDETYDVFLGTHNVTAEYTYTFELTIHVDTVSPTCQDYYKINFHARAEREAPACEEIPPYELEKCFEFKAFQYLEAYPIQLYKKWNLISTPLVPVCCFPDMEAALKSFKYPKLLKSIWHYDRCADDWAVYDLANNITSLDHFKDGKGYWFRMLTAGELAAAKLSWPYECTDPVNWWVWGTEGTVPPLNPSEYAVCEGWNMIGFSSSEDKDIADYLWNFYNFHSMPLFGPAYGWDASDHSWAPKVPEGDPLEPGMGYWVPFAYAGTIYP